MDRVLFSKDLFPLVSKHLDSVSRRRMRSVCRDWMRSVPFIQKRTTIEKDKYKITTADVGATSGKEVVSALEIADFALYALRFKNHNLLNRENARVRVSVNYEQTPKAKVLFKNGKRADIFPEIDLDDTTISFFHFNTFSVEFIPLSKPDMLLDMMKSNFIKTSRFLM